ncbi:MAG: DUF4855 domain-containing protein, partial [Thermoproteota archaeon]
MKSLMRILKLASTFLCFFIISNVLQINSNLNDLPPRNIALVYTDSREGVYMTKDQLLPLVVYFNDSKAVDTFFDGFLFLGIRGPSGGSYETGTAND